MIYDVIHRDFTENKVQLKVTRFKCSLIYNDIPAKSRWGTFTLIDDNSVERRLRILDKTRTATNHGIFVSIDTNDVVEVIKNNSKILFYISLTIFILFVIKFNIINGGLCSLLALYSIRFQFLRNDSKSKIILQSLVAIILAAALAFSISKLVSILINLYK